MALPKTTDADADRGFLMVALLIAMAVVAIWMTAALPSWRQQAQREKEEDLIFRGEQYAMAIVLYQNKNRGASPPDIDILVSQRFLRKKWKDPVTGCDFLPIGRGVVTDANNCPKYAKVGTTQPLAAPTTPTGNQQVGIIGVRSQSPATSIKIYATQQQHSQWRFDAQTIRNDKQMGGVPGLDGGRGGGDGRGGPTPASGAPGRGGVGAPGRGGDAAPAGRGGAPPPPPRPIGRGGN